MSAVVSPAEWAWRAWFLGEGQFAQYGPHDPSVRLLTAAPQRIPAEWWQRLEEFLTRRADHLEPKRSVRLRDRVSASARRRRQRAPGQVSPHFNVREFDCHDGRRVPVMAVPALKRLAVVFLEPLRTQFGPAHVMSGYRPADYNRRIGGARFSQHIYELTPDSVAADLVFAEGTPAQWANAARRIAIRKGLGGVGQYNRSGFLHVDNGPRRDWWG